MEPHRHHPNVPTTQSEWSEGQVLHVAAAISNPFRWRARRELANDFRRHMAASPNVVLHFVELAYGDRPFDCTEAGRPGNIQLRTNCELFHKENLLNIAVRDFPSDWRYGAIIDADFHLTRHDWALETVHQLQHHEWVQLFSTYSCLSDGDHERVSTDPGFAYCFYKNGGIPREWQEGWNQAPYSHRHKLPRVGSPGGAWGFRRSAFDAVGGLLDKSILGSSDWFMAFGLFGSDEPLFEDGWVSKYSLDYYEVIRAWQVRATAALRRNIGYVPGHAVHHWHGPMKKRGYGTRDEILVRNHYEPTRDVYYDWQGVLTLTPHKPQLRDDIRRYFRSRSEDLPFEVE